FCAPEVNGVNVGADVGSRPIGGPIRACAALRSPTSMAGERVLVVGCGGIGGIIAAHLIERGHDISVLTTNPAIARALRERGLEVRGQRPLRVPAPRVLEAVDDA